jgi:hypothetical protein
MDAHIVRDCGAIMAHHETLPENNLTKLRSLAHELSNSLEVIMQAQYLLEHSEPSGEEKWAAKWIDMIGKAIKEASEVNGEIRQILRSASVMQAGKEPSVLSTTTHRRHSKKNAAS